MTRSLNKWVVIAIGLFMSTFAFAKEGPCQVDIEKFCASVPKGREMAKCLATHKDELSPSCKGKYQEMKARVRSVREACLDDAEKFCAGLERNKFEPAAKAISRCLKGRETELSKECKESLGNKKRKRK